MMTISYIIHVNRERLLYAIVIIIRLSLSNSLEVKEYLLAIIANLPMLLTQSRDFEHFNLLLNPHALLTACIVNLRDIYYVHFVYLLWK